MITGPYSKHFNHRDFFRTTRKLSGRLLEHALILWLVLTDEKTPVRVKIAIVAALGYLICPVDAVCDFVPLGFVDDLAVLTALVLSLEAYISEEHRQQARNWREPPELPPESPPPAT